MKRLIPFLAIALIGTVVDLITKTYVFHLVGYTSSSPSAKLSIIPGVLEFWPQLNTGIIWGLFREANIILLIILPLLAIPLIIMIFFLASRHIVKDLSVPPKTDWFITISLGLILGGALGNLYDRIFHSGVRDFIHYYYLIDWPTFNLADAYISIGAILMIVTLFRKEPNVKSITQNEVTNAAENWIGKPESSEVNPDKT